MTQPTPRPLFPSAEAEAGLLRAIARRGGVRVYETYPDKGIGYSYEFARSVDTSLPPLHPGDFSVALHRVIWRAMVRLAYRGPWIDARAVAAEAQRISPGCAAAVSEVLGG